MRTAATNVKVRDIISSVRDGRIIPKPEFQRRLVWTTANKRHFVDSVLLGYPFPEIYLADGEVDLATGEGTRLLVDGLQRVTTLVEFFSGTLALPGGVQYRDLTDAQKTQFLQYDVAVRDLGAVSREEIVEVFKRINATQYSLREIEISNAVYAGALKQFANRMAEHEFFVKHATFTTSDLRRMGDLRYTLTLIATMISGYSNRDDAIEEHLSAYNEAFEMAGPLEERLNRVFDFVDECGFPANSRVWKKTDLFTLLCELDSMLESGRRLVPGRVVRRLTRFYDAVDAAGQAGESIIVQQYHQAALQASNDRVNRIRRGIIINGLLRSKKEDTIVLELGGLGFRVAELPFDLAD